MGLAESTPSLNVAFIDGSIEEPNDLIVSEFCQRAHVLVRYSALVLQMTKGCRERLVVVVVADGLHADPSYLGFSITWFEETSAEDPEGDVVSSIPQLRPERGSRCV